MVNSKRMSEKEKGMIEAYKDQGKSFRWIGKKIGRHESSIRYYINNVGRTKQKRGPKQKLSEGTKRLIIRNASNKSISISKIKSDMNLNVSTETIRCVLRDCKTMQYQKMKAKPPLKKQHKENRLLWAKQKMGWVGQWRNVIWSDEKKFNLDGPDGLAFYWHDLRKEELNHSRRHTGGGSLMIWACFNFYGKSSLASVSGKQDQWEYQKHLTNHLLPFMEKYGGSSPIFQQDNSRCHIARSTLQWLQDRNIEKMNWPAYSPDLNPIENLWGVLCRRVYSDGRQFHTLDDLKSAVFRSWEEIDKSTLENMVNSMPDRIYQLILNKGSSTKY